MPKGGQEGGSGALRYRFVWLTLIAVVLLGGYLAYRDYAAWLYYAAGRYDRMMNPYGIDPEAPVPTPEDQAFHRSLFIADMHADTLKWERDMLERSIFGHVDLPRLMDGNVALQVFTIVSKSPMRMPWSGCVSGQSPDRALALAAFQGRPFWGSRQRAYYQIERFHDAVERSRENGDIELRLIASAEDLRQLVADRMAGKRVVGGILGVEGAHWIGGDDMSGAEVQEEVQDLFDAGVRLFAPVHRFDNGLSGSSEGCVGYGLTEHGRIALREAESLGMVVDLAHISPAAMRDSVELLERPFTVSHTGIQQECDAPCRPDRNLSDEEIGKLLQGGGVIGVGYWPQAVGPSVWRIVDIMDHIGQVAETLGLPTGRQIALGSDYDGSVTPLIEVGHLDVLTAIMRQRPSPLDTDAIRDIAGRNACRLFAAQLPGGNRFAARRLCADAGSTTRLDLEDETLDDPRYQDEREEEEE